MGCINALEIGRILLENRINKSFTDYFIILTISVRALFHKVLKFGIDRHIYIRYTLDTLIFISHDYDITH
jgi:hypothetical protein